MRHPVIGEIELNYQSFELPGEPGLRFNVFTAEPGSRNQEALRFLASWADTHLDRQTATATEVAVRTETGRDASSTST